MESTNVTKNSKSFKLNNNLAKCHVLFWVHQTDIKKERGEVSVYLRLTYKGKRAEMSTGVEGRLSDWNSTKKRFKNNDVANAMLVQVELEVNRVFADLRLSRAENLTVHDIMAGMKGHTLEEKIPSIETLLSTYLLMRESSYQRGEITKGSIYKERNYVKRIKQFSAQRYGKNARIAQVIPADARHFMEWLKNESELSHNVSIKIAQYFKRVLNYALECEYITRNPLMLFTSKKEQKRGEYLTEDELQRIEQLNILHEVGDSQRDCFLFSCYTGLAWVDLRNLREHNIHQTTDGYHYIFKERQKTQQPTVIPLTKEALRLIDKYRTNEYCRKNGLMLPLLPNQKVNIYLKQLAAIAGINKRLTFHVARRTAAQIALNRGVDTKALTSFMGHASISMTEKQYARIEPATVIREFKDKFGDAI